MRTQFSTALISAVSILALGSRAASLNFSESNQGSSVEAGLNQVSESKMSMVELGEDERERLIHANCSYCPGSKEKMCCMGDDEMVV